MGDKGECAAFLVNTDEESDAEVQFQNQAYKLPRLSISILPDCKTVAFNTAKASIRMNNITYWPNQEVYLLKTKRCHQQVSTQYSTRTMEVAVKLDLPEMWQEFDEVIPVFNDTSSRSDSLLEQMNTTKDASDYLWYTAR